MKKLFLLAMLFAAAVSQAQFLGYTSPQTVTQILATNVPCTGGLQTFQVNNFAQSSHLLQFAASGNATGGLTVGLTGSYDGVSFPFFGDIASDFSGQVQATGYYPSIKASVQCGLAAGTFSLQYSGTSSYQLQPTGFTDRASYNKLLAFQLAANVNSSNLFLTTPYGNTAAVLVFQYGGTPPVAPSTFNVTAQSDQIPAFSLITGQVLQANNSVQTFLLPTFAAVQVNFQYQTGGASTGNYTAQLMFFKSGYLIPSADPCQSQWGPYVKQSFSVTAAAAATTQIVPPIPGLTPYICGYQISQAVLAGTMQWVSGTGGTCGTNNGIVTGPMQTIVGQPFTYSGPGFISKPIPPGAGLCLTTTGAGATAGGIITIVYAP